MREESSLPFGRGLMTVLALCCAARVHAAEPALPDGWQPLTQPSLAGSFLYPGSQDVALLARHGAGYGLVVVPDRASGVAARVVSSFDDAGVNPPRLALVQPGSYQPRCAAGDRCAPVMLDTQAIGLCFGEASCKIIYFDGKAFHEIFVTD